MGSFHSKRRSFQVQQPISPKPTAEAEAFSVSALSHVDEIWTNIANNILKWRQKYLNGNYGECTNPETPDETTRQGWKVVRVFVSSTFSDFHAEREVLVKRVFPELREWCDGRQIHIIECDLRWGVPKDTSTPDVVNICLEEIDSCISLTGGNPFFINLLGERYGWVPTVEDLSQQVVEKYDWIPELSITHMEILHGAFRTQSKNAAFFLRDSAFISDVPDDFMPSFVEEDASKQEQLQRLKEYLNEHFPDCCFSYSPTVDGKYSYLGSEKLKLGNLDQFAKDVTQFLKDTISSAYPDISAKADTPEELSRRAQEAFINKKGSDIVGRDDEIKKILTFLLDDIETVREDQSGYLFVLGEPGLGKSSLTARVAIEAGKNNCRSFFNFASASPGSTAAISILKRLISEISVVTDTKSIEEAENEMSVDELKQRFCKEVNLLGDRKDQRFLLLFDAVNQISGADGSNLVWLPRELPKNVKCVISSIPSHDGLPSLKSDLTGEIIEIHLTGFVIADKIVLVETILKRYKKKLDSDQLQLLVQHAGSHSPLWLSLACEELRMFGVFEQLTSIIKQLPESIKDLLVFILERIVEEDETNCVKDLLCFLLCSMNGLTETDLRCLLGGTEELPMVTWATARRKVKPFLIHTGRCRDEEFVVFFHQSMREVIFESFIGEKSVAKDYYCRMVEYLKLHPMDEMRFQYEYPYYLKEAGDSVELLRFLKQDPRAVRIPQHVRSTYTKPLRCTQFLRGLPPAFVAPVVICLGCSMQSGNLIPRPYRNGDACVVCGCFLHFKGNLKQGLLCQRHRTHTALCLGHAKCHVCKKMVFLGDGKPPHSMHYSKCHVCQWCSLNLERCCYVG